MKWDMTDMPSATTLTRRRSIVSWHDTAGYGERINATADSEEELLSLRTEWYAKRNPQGYGEAIIRPLGDGRYCMRQSLSSD